MVIKAENPCSATGGGSTNLSFPTNGGLKVCSEFANISDASIVLTRRLL
jgi:hypothetical protein